MKKVFIVLALLIVGLSFLAVGVSHAQDDKRRHHHHKDPPAHLIINGNGNSKGEVIEYGDGSSRFVLSGRQLDALRWYIIHSSIPAECDVTTFERIDPPLDDIPVFTNSDGRFDVLVGLSPCPQNNYSIWIEGPWTCNVTFLSCTTFPTDFVYSASTTTYSTTLDLDSPQR